VGNFEHDFKRPETVHPTVKYCPNCKGDLTSVPKRLLFRCSTCRRNWKVDEFSVDECKRCGTNLKNGYCMDETCPHNNHLQDETWTEG